MAKKIKDAHPDVLLDKVIVPKLGGASSGGNGNGGGASGDSEKNKSVGGTFEVLVDGKVVLLRGRTKDRDASSAGCEAIFVSMQEIEVAISRARKRRRPSTVYGEEDSNVRLELLKAKVGGMTRSANTASNDKQ